MNLNHLKYFLHLANTLNYTQTAKCLNISQPALSIAIKSLEQELKISLFIKKGRSVALSNQGLVLKGFVEEGLATLQKGFEAISDLLNPSQGVINIGYIYTLGSKYIPKLIKDFQLLNEDYRVHFNLLTGNTYDVLELLSNQKVDLVFCSLPQSESTVIEFKQIGKEPLVLITPKNHRLSSKKEIDLQSITNEEIILYSQSSGLRSVIDNICAKHRIHFNNIAYEIEEDSSIAGLVEEGLSVAIMPDMPLLRAFNVAKIPLKNQYQQRQIYIATLKDTIKSPLVSKFYDYVLNIDFLENIHE